MHGPRQETCRGCKVAVRKVAHAKFEAFHRDFRSAGGCCRFWLSRCPPLCTGLYLLSHLKIVGLSRIRILKGFVRVSDLRKCELDATKQNGRFAMESVRSGTASPSRNIGI